MLSLKNFVNFFFFFFVITSLDCSSNSFTDRFVRLIVRSRFQHVCITSSTLFLIFLKYFLSIIYYVTCIANYPSNQLYNTDYVSRIRMVSSVFVSYVQQISHCLWLYVRFRFKCYHTALMNCFKTIDKYWLPPPLTN